jgi:hypothetical protein
VYRFVATIPQMANWLPDSSGAAAAAESRYSACYEESIFDTGNGLQGHDDLLGPAHAPFWVHTRLSLASVKRHRGANTFLGDAC